METYSGRCGARLRKLREKAGLSVETIATELGVSYGAIYRWEAGKADPKLDHLPKLSELFGLKSPRNVLADQ